MRRALPVLMAALVGCSVLSPAPATAAGHVPVIVIDPGHSRTVDAIDKQTGLRVDDYENEPEMRNVFAVAQLVATQLRALGYRVVLTKTSVNQRRNLAQRAHIADAVHADLAISIHDQAGRDGGIGFRKDNNIVYYQSVGDYRATPRGHHVVFRNKAVAALSMRYARKFAAARGAVQHVREKVRGDVGYNLGSRGLAPGNIWMVQLLAHVPWIYNEAGGNSAGHVGLTAKDRRSYARSLVAGVEACIPAPKAAATG